MRTLRHHVLVLQKTLCAQSFPRPYLERGMFTASPAFWLKHSKSMGSFGRCLTVSIRHKWAVSKPRGCLWSSKLGDPQRGNAGAGQDILNRASKNARVIRLHVQWVRMSQAWVWSHYFQCNSWDSTRSGVSRAALVIPANRAESAYWSIRNVAGRWN